MKRLIIVVLILFTNYNANCNKYKPFYLKYNMFGLLSVEPNLYLEQLNVKRKQSVEIGFSLYSGASVIRVLYDLGQYSSTKTSGGEYGTLSINRPIYTLFHQGIGVTAIYKFYSKSLNKYIGPHFTFSSRILNNQLYTSEDLANWNTSANNYYWFRANHSTKKIGLLCQTGYVLKNKNYAIREFGVALGCNINFDKLDYIEWGTKGYNTDPNFQAKFPTLPKTKYTDGVFTTFALRIFCNLGKAINVTYK